MEVWGWCCQKHDRAGPPSPGVFAREPMMACVCAPVSSKYKRKTRNEIASGHLVSM